MSFAPRSTLQTPASAASARGRFGGGGGVGDLLSSLRGTLNALQRDSEDAVVLEAESAGTFQALCRHVAALQKSFVTLADAVTEELDQRRDEQAAALAQVDQLALELQRRLGGSERQEALVNRLREVEARVAANEATGRAAVATTEAAIALQGRCAHLEAANAALEARVQMLAAQQAKQARSLEDTARALVADATNALRVARAADSGVAVLKRVAAEHHGALARTSRTFAEVLNVPNPLGAGGAPLGCPCAGGPGADVGAVY